MGPYFETWKHQTLVRFAKESYEKLQRQEEELQRLRLALRERLAQPEHEWLRGECVKCGQSMEQEPVAWLAANGTLLNAVSHPELYTPLYTTPPRREWVGLTDEEIAVICGECAASAHRTDDISYARAIEAKLREKNA